MKKPLFPRRKQRLFNAFIKVVLYRTRHTRTQCLTAVSRATEAGTIVHTTVKIDTGTAVHGIFVDATGIYGRSGSRRTRCAHVIIAGKIIVNTAFVIGSRIFTIAVAGIVVEIRLTQTVYVHSFVVFDIHQTYGYDDNAIAVSGALTLPASTAAIPTIA